MWQSEESGRERDARWRKRLNQLADEAAQHGDLLGAALCAKALGDDLRGYALNEAQRENVESATKEEVIRQVNHMLHDEAARKAGG
jgi:hypothetical protein